MPVIPLLRAGAIRPFSRLLGGMGAPVERLWQRAGLPPRALEQDDGLLPLGGLHRFLDGAARAQGVPELGVLAAQQTEFWESGEFQLRIARSRTLFEAFERTRTLVSAHNSGARWWIARIGDEVRICRRTSPGGLTSLQNDLFTVTQAVALIRHSAGPDWRPRQVTLQHPGPVSLAQVDVFSEARVLCGRFAASVTLPSAFLCRPLSWERPLPSEGASNAWLTSGPPHRLVDSVRVFVRSLLDLGDLDVRVAAEAARMSVRTFQRRLGLEGTTFSSLVEEVRFETARTLVGESDRKLIEIALDLGYSDPAHFTRAFRRWTSVSPAAYRRLHGSAPSGRVRR